MLKNLHTRRYKIMKTQKLIIKIDCSAQELFAFTMNPDNTPKWIDTITREQTNERPTRLGTIYKHQNKEGKWLEYEITAFKENEMFIMSLKDSTYHVKYTFMPIGPNSTEFEYFEWMDEGKLEVPFLQEGMQKLKAVLESKL